MSQQSGRASFPQGPGRTLVCRCPVKSVEHRVARRVRAKFIRSRLKRIVLWSAVAHGVDPANRFICARRRRRRTRGLFGNGSIFATRWLGRYGKCADQWHRTRSCEPGRNEQYEDRSERHRQCCQDDTAATAEHSCPDAAGRFANSGRTSADDRRAVNAGGGIRDTSPAARRSSAIGKRPDESEQSSQPGERGARPHARHLPRLLNTHSAPYQALETRTRRRGRADAARSEPTSHACAPRNRRASVRHAEDADGFDAPSDEDAAEGSDGNGATRGS
jgi:hypothetical protein